MVKALLDSSILIDLLRRHPPAITWFTGQVDLGASTIVWIELIQGAQNSHAQQKSVQLLRQLQRIEINDADMDWAIKRLISYNLSHKVGGVDCLIAAPSYRLQIPLYTMNLKHFTPILGTLAQKPY
jgi:predicted nucleic acid-binding protein